MSDPAPIDLTDPLLPEFARQHDLRERYLEALEAIVATEIPRLTHKPGVAVYKAAYERVIQIASEAINEDSIAAWERAGRPLFMDAALQEAGKSFDEMARAVLGIELAAEGTE